VFGENDNRWEKLIVFGKQVTMLGNTNSIVGKIKATYNMIYIYIYIYKKGNIFTYPMWIMDTSWE
jgi:hypothetical protein